jgi:hypothetical protein
MTTQMLVGCWLNGLSNTKIEKMPLFLLFQREVSQYTRAFDEEKVKEILGIPEEVRIVGLMPNGYPATQVVRKESFTTSQNRKI